MFQGRTAHLVKIGNNSNNHKREYVGVFQDPPEAGREFILIINEPVDMGYAQRDPKEIFVRIINTGPVIEITSSLTEDNGLTYVFSTETCDYVLFVEGVSK